MKICISCREKKEISEFGKDNKQIDKKMKTCKKCVNKRYIKKGRKRKDTEGDLRLSKKEKKILKANILKDTLNQNLGHLKVNKAYLFDECIKVNVSDTFYVYLYPSFSLIELFDTSKKIPCEEIKEKVIAFCKNNLHSIKEKLVN